MTSQEKKINKKIVIIKIKSAVYSESVREAKTRKPSLLLKAFAPLPLLRLEILFYFHSKKFTGSDRSMSLLPRPYFVRPSCFSSGDVGPFAQQRHSWRLHSSAVSSILVCFCRGWVMQTIPLIELRRARRAFCLHVSLLVSRRVLSFLLRLHLAQAGMPCVPTWEVPFVPLKIATTDDEFIISIKAGPSFFLSLSVALSLAGFQKQIRLMKLDVRENSG